MKNKALLPILAGFFVMGFGDIIGTVMIQVKAECSAHADAIAWLMPVFAYCWFALISIPTGLMCGRVGRKNAVLASLAVTVAAMFLPFAFLACVFVVALMTANSFGMCMGLAIAKFPEKANEITALMVMAIVGGGLVSAALGPAQKAFGVFGIVAVLLVCLAYLLALGLFARGRE